ncbi:MAG TPA: UvrD-helicase domain-containing protein [Dehalococcoidia bacterium]|nr:UvrD-helicase domain-containing protein [Dehalococcoidia bacterium]
MDILAGLNPAQREAVETIEGPVLIVAGPGSGKTRVIAHRVAYLITVCGISPHRILAVTFTNKAAREMKERIYALLGRVVEGLTLGTFHATCARILRMEAEHIGLDRSYIIYDEGDQLSLLKRSIEQVGLDPRQYPPGGIRAAISSAKARLLAPQDYRGQVDSYFEEIVARVYERYQELLAESSALDFDDLIMRTVHLFRSQPDVLDRYQFRYLHVMIDEFQDTNRAQYILSRQLAGKYRNICVVGDPDQSIYSWRHADLRHILDFENDYPDVKVLYLEQNYRSTQTILEAADRVIAANQHRKEKELWTENEAGEHLTVAQTYSEQDEAHFVVSEIEKLVTSGRWGAGDCAIMYRTNAQSRALEETFVRYGFPYKLVGATRFYERREVKDIIAYLRLIYNPYDGVSLARIINVPVRGIGQRTIAELTMWANERGLPYYDALKLIAGGEEDTTFASRSVQALSNFLNMLDEFIAQGAELNLLDLFDLVLERSGYKSYTLESADGEERWENIMELRNVAAGYHDLEPREALAYFLEEVALVSDVDDLDEKVEAVTLITLHQAKGLEFPVVFIVGMEEGVLPHFRSFPDPGQMEEERRLCYVGITRAKEKVYLVHALRRSLMGSSAHNPPSRFLDDIPLHLVASAGALTSETWYPQQATRRIPTANEAHEARAADTGEPPVFKAGDHVSHAMFGEGIVVNCIATGGDHEVTIAFKGDAGVKRFLLSLAPLQKMS